MDLLSNLDLPCPVNRLWRSANGRTILSKEGRDKAARMVAQMREQWGQDPVSGDVQVTITWRARSRVYCDVDAYCKQTLDCLAKAGVIADDKQVTRLDVLRIASDARAAAVAKGKMRVRVESDNKP